MNELRRKKLIDKGERRLKKLLRDKADEEMAGSAHLYLHFDNGAPPRRVVPRKIVATIIDNMEGELKGERTVGLRVVRGGRA